MAFILLLAFFTFIMIIPPYFSAAKLKFLRPLYCKLGWHSYYGNTTLSEVDSKGNLVINKFHCSWCNQVVSTKKK